MKRRELVLLGLVFIMSILVAVQGVHARQDVTITGPFPFPVTGDVTVINNPTEPVPTRDVDNPARRPVQEGVAAPSGTLTGGSNFVLFTVPAGKRLVVEHFSSEVGILSTASLNRYVLGIAPEPNQPGNSIFAHFIAPTYHSPCGTCGSGYELFVASQPIRMYVDAGQALVLNITFSGAVGDYAFGFFAISGYLINVQ